jgi:hypothetical protein
MVRLGITITYLIQGHTITVATKAISEYLIGLEY